MTQLGSDVDQLAALAGAFERAADRLGAMHAETTAAMTATWWVGPDAERTRTWWRASARATVSGASQQLRDGAGDLRRQVDQQRAASGLDGPAHTARLLAGIGRWAQERVDEVGDWFGDRWRELQWRGDQDGARIGSVTVSEDDDEDQPRGFGVPAPLDDWARDGAEEVVDRGSTLIDYGVRTADRRIEHPFQSLMDIGSGTAFAEDLSATLQIGLGDAEIVDTPYGNDAVFLTNGWAPFEGGAITIGHTVSVDSPVPPKDHLVRHEMQHVYDIEDVGGVGFYGSYGGDWLWNYAVEGRTGPNEAYRDVVWEQRGYHTGGDPSNPEPGGVLGGFWKDLWSTR